MGAVGKQFGEVHLWSVILKTQNQEVIKWWMIDYS
jgi:hypothetical protein